MAAACASMLAGNATTSSSCMRMSESSRFWISMLRSGDMKCSEPSMCERKRTPSSVILRKEDRDIT